MSERHKRKNAREMLSKAGYRSGGHFGSKMIGEEVRKGVDEHEANMHPGLKHTKLKLKEGGSVTSAAFGARTHKPRGHKGKHSKTTVNVVVAPGGGGPKPMPIPVPMGGPPPIGPGAPAMVGPGMPPSGPMPGAKRGGRFCDGGSVKDSEASQRDTVKSTSGKVEGKLKKGGKAKKSKNKYDFGGPVSPGGPGIDPWGSSRGNTVLGVNPGGPGTSAGGGASWGGNPLQGPGTSAGGNGPGLSSGQGAGWGGDPLQGPGPRGGRGQPLPNNNFSPGAFRQSFCGGGSGAGAFKKGGKAKTADPEMDGGAGGGLGRLEKAESYGAKVKRGGKAK